MKKRILQKSRFNDPSYISVCVVEKFYRRGLDQTKAIILNGRLSKFKIQKYFKTFFFAIIMLLLVYRNIRVLKTFFHLLFTTTSNLMGMIYLYVVHKFKQYCMKVYKTNFIFLSFFFGFCLNYLCHYGRHKLCVFA